MTNAIWWPPEVGDKLRHFTLHTDGNTGGTKQVHALVHVLATFEHDGQILATVAEWLPSRRRWVYTTIMGWLEAEIAYWPDGYVPPNHHAPCAACRGSE